METKECRKELKDRLYSYDMRYKYNKALSDFLGLYKGKNINSLPDMPLTKLNVEVIGMINDFNIRYFKVNRIFKVVTKYFESNIDEYNSRMYRAILTIYHSLKRQFKKIKYTKNIFKKVPLNSKNDVYNGILILMSDSDKRLDHLLDNILPEYIAVTPLFDYNKMLEDRGTNLYDDIIDTFPIDLSLSYKGEQDVCRYIENIMSLVTTSFWLENRESMIKRSEFNIMTISKHKKSELIKAAQDKARQTEETLFTHINLLHRNFDNAFQSPAHVSKGVCGNNTSQAILILKKKALLFKDENHCESAKIIVLGNVKAGQKATPKYYNKNNVKLMSTGISNATILKVDSPLPEEIQTMVDNYEYAYAEFLI